MREIARGAEAVLYEDKDRIIKIRPKKNYRVKEIDEELRKRRTKKEASLLQKLAKKGIKVPSLIETDNLERIEMQRLEGNQVKFLLDQDIQLAEKIGSAVAKLHGQDVIHSDLTTSNMIVEGKEVFLIDFGLAFHSTRIEDKAVDIHLFKQALESRHHKVMEKAYRMFLKGYKSYEGYEKVLERLRAVERRGRYKQK